jgi:hypothetical protein
MAADWLKVMLAQDAASKQNEIQEACTKLWQQAGAPSTAAMFVTKDIAGAGEHALYFSPTMATICHDVIAPYSPIATEAPTLDEVDVLLRS